MPIETNNLQDQSTRFRLWLAARFAARLTWLAMAPLFSVPLLQKSFAGNGFHGARRWYTPRSRTEFRFFRTNNMFFIVFQFFFHTSSFSIANLQPGGTGRCSTIASGFHGRWSIGSPASCWNWCCLNDVWPLSNLQIDVSSRHQMPWTRVGILQITSTKIALVHTARIKLVAVEVLSDWLSSQEDYLVHNKKIRQNL